MDLDPIFALKDIAGNVFEQVDQLEPSFFTFDYTTVTKSFTYGGMDCLFQKHPASSATIHPPYIHYVLKAMRGKKKYGPEVGFWVLHPSRVNLDVNRAALKKALAKYRDQLTATSGQVDLAEEPLPVSLVMVSSISGANKSSSNRLGYHPAPIVVQFLHIKVIVVCYVQYI